MSKFSVQVVKITDILPHSNADKLEIVKVLGFDVITSKNFYKKDDFVAYIPEASILPDDVANKLGVLGKLSGGNKDRVKAIALRGFYSQGLIYPVSKISEDKGIIIHPNGATLNVILGDDVSDFLNITKYKVEVPLTFSGELFPIELSERVSFDIENIKNYPDLIKDGEEVVFTEKLHGTFTEMIYLPPAYVLREGVDYPETFNSEKGILMVSSKSQSEKGFMFKKTGNGNEKNVYLKAAEDNNVLEKLSLFFENYNYPVVVMGETFGYHVQDLQYGIEKGDNRGFRVFSIYTKEDGVRFKPVNSDDLDDILKFIKLDRVPVLYKGKFNQDVLEEFTKGKETVSGRELHIREGIVITPLVERYEIDLKGRLILKSINLSYLTRKGGTEYN